MIDLEIFTLAAGAILCATIAVHAVAVLLASL
jgi:hypothetical protein